MGASQTHVWFVLVFKAQLSFALLEYFPAHVLVTAFFCFSISLLMFFFI